MSQTIRGTYKNGVVQLDHPPEGVAEARVVVAFVEDPATPSGLKTRRRGTTYFGMFAPTDGRFTTDEELQRVRKSWNTQIETSE